MIRNNNLFIRCKAIVLVLFITFLLSGNRANTQNLYFPPLTGNQWDSVSPSLLGWNQTAIDTLYNYLDARNTKAFILLRDGRIVLERYFGTFTSDSLWYWASAGKSLTAFLIGMAQEENMLSIEDTVSDYLGNGWTSATSAQEEKITIRHQLMMTTGLDDDVPDPDCTLPSCLLFKADAGTRWAYHNAPYTLLDEVIQAASGISMNTIIATRLQPKTGISGLFLPLGYNNVFFSKPRMMARFGLLVLNRGSWDSVPVLSDTVYFNQMVNSSQSMNPAYGYLWWLNGKSKFMLPGIQFQFNGSICPNAPSDMIMALGKNGQFLNIVPGTDMVMVRMGNSPGTSDISAAINDTIWQLLNMVITSGLDRHDPPEVNRFSLSPNPASDIIRLIPSADMYSGRYSYRILTVSGVSVSEGTGYGESLVQTSSLSRGVYIIQVVTEDGKHWQGKFLRL